MRLQWLVFSAFLLWQGGMQPQEKPKFEPGKTYEKNVPIMMGDGMTWKWSFQESAEANSFPFDECGPICQGAKHANHAACDLTCDIVCFYSDKEHRRTLPPVFIEIGSEGTNPPARSHADTMNRDFTEFRFPSTWNAQRYLSGVGRELSSSISDGSPFPSGFAKSKCWNTSPCSKAPRSVKAKTYLLSIEYELYSDPDGPGPLPREKGPKRTIRYKVLVGTEELMEPSAPVSNCRCEVPVQAEPPKEHGYLPGGMQGEGEYAFVEKDGKKRVMTGQDLTALVPTVTVNDMNTATFTIASMPSTRAFIPAGWELQCVDGGGQNVQLQEDLEIGSLVQEAHLQVNVTPDAARTIEKTLRVLCLQIDAPEPRPKMKYRLVPPSSPSLARLARITRRSSFKGPPDQVRLWIATDFASHAKISKILFPAPKEALYLREMYRAANVNAINSSDPRVIAIMENRLLTGEGNDPIAVAWFAQNNLRTGGNSTPDWIQSNLSEFAKLFSGGQPKDDIAVLSAICSELAAVGNKDCLSAGISLIQGAVPPEHRESMYQSTGAFLLANRLSTIIDEAAADAILDWLESSKPFFTAAVVRSVNPRLSAETKQRAAALLKQ